MASKTVPPTATANETRLEITVAVLFGAVLALAGVLGPVLGGSDGHLLLFGRNYLHDVIHIATGVSALTAGYYRGGQYARVFLKTFGAIYLVVTAAGFLFPGLLGDLIALNMADNLLHLAVAVIFLGVGYGVGSD